VDVSLLRTPASGDLLPARLAPVLAKWTSPRAKLRGQQLILAIDLSLDEEAAAGFVLDFAGQGARVEAVAHGVSAPLLAWAFGELAKALKAERTGDDAPLEAAIAYLKDYEADVAAHRANRPDDEANAFVRWLRREEVIDVREGATFDDLPLDDSTYELLLEHEDVEDIFVSERELARLLARFRAR
jgi:hypothetical protein